jgi:hypothetical protein
VDKENDFYKVGKPAILVCVSLAFFSLPVLSQIINGDFETSEPNRLGNIPTGWETENYALIHESYTPMFERGQTVDWSFADATVTPAQGDGFLVLSTGDMGSDSSTTYGLARQLVKFTSGQTLHGKYFFGTGDYLGWNDYAEIRAIPKDPNRLRGFQIEYIDVAIVGDYGSTDGWETFSHTFTKDDEGEYYLTFGVYDKTDAIYKSYLMIDDIQCGILPPEGDYNADGLINYADIITFNQVVYQDCNDVNSICHYVDLAGNVVSYDYNDDGWITPEDVEPVIQNWLWKPEED